MKFGGNYEIWSTPISLVWMSLIHNNELMVRLGTFVIVIVFVFVVVFLLVRSCFLITLIKCLKVQKYQILLSEGALYMYLSLSLCLSSSLSFCWSGHVFSSPWSNVSKVKSLKDCSLKVFSKCICHCLCICLRHCLFVGHVFLWPQSILQGFGLVWKAGRLWIQHNQSVSEWVSKVDLELLGQLKIRKGTEIGCR